MSHFSRDGLLLAYEVVGEGFPVVLHTGAAGDSRMWSDAGYVEGLTGFRVVRFDHRGHGASGLPLDPTAHGIGDLVTDVVTLADELGFDRLAFWGYSHGARVGYALAAAHPRRVAALIASGGVDPLDRDPQERREAARRVRERGVGAILGDESAPDWLLRQLVRDTNPEVVAREIECSADWSPWPLFPRIEAPTLIVAGGDEDAGCREAAARIPNGSALILPGLGHLEAFVRSDLVLPEARRFLDGATLEAMGDRPLGR